MDFFTLLESFFRELAVNPLRRGLSILGVIIGTAAVIASLAVIEGGREQLQGFIERLGVNLVFLEDRYEPKADLPAQAEPEMTDAAPGGGRPGPAPDAPPPAPAPAPETSILPQQPETLTQRDVDGLARALPAILRIAPQMVLRTDISRPGEKPMRAQLEGGTPDGAAIRNLRMARGRYLVADDLTRAARVCVLGHGLATRLFPGGPAKDDTLFLLGARWRVIGVLEPRGNLMGFDYDNRVIVPLTAAQERTGTKVINGLLIQARNTPSALRLRDELPPEILARLPDRNQEDFRVFCQDELLRQKEQTLDTFRLLAASIAAFSLVVSGIGIMNIMLVTVKERTREIGVWKAVGARDRDVLSYFLAESVLTCMLGGLFGVLLGIFFATSAAGFIAESITETEGWSPVFRPVFFLVAVGTASLVGLLSGIFPAVTASKLDPAEALRYE